jgi:hypothetical protein
MLSSANHFDQRTAVENALAGSDPLAEMLGFSGLSR